MDEGIPALGVSFEIDDSQSVETLSRLEAGMDRATLAIIAEAAKIERATGGMLKLGAATAEIKALGNAATRDLANVARETAKVERAGEGLSRQMDRQISTFGKSRAEIRAMSIEAQILASEQLGLTEQAGRLRAQHATLQAAMTQATEAAEREAEAIRQAAFAHQMFEARVRQGAAAMREAEAAALAASRQETVYAGQADALRAKLDPMFSAQQRFNRELDLADDLLRAGAITQREYASATELARRTLADHATAVAGSNVAVDANGRALARQTASAVNNRMAMQGASYQVQDFITQVSMGANPVNAFAVQGAQLAGQFSNIEGKAGNVARFFMGPWGLAITAGMMLLGPFVAKLLEGNNALDDAVNKLRKDANETDITAKAKDRFKLTQEGVNAAIRDQEDALKKSIEAEKSAAEQANISAKADLAREMQIRSNTIALLEQAKAQADIANSTNFGAGGGAGAGMAKGAYAEQVTAITASLKTAEESLLKLQRGVEYTRIDLAAEEAKRMTDPIERIKKLYDDQVNAAKNAARAQIAAGVELDHSRSVVLANELARIERARQAAIKAEQDKQAAGRQTVNQIGRNIDLLEARQIAQSVGGRVTSDQRSYDTQKALYEKYQAYKAGTGPWAALAAKPGTSNHELGQAIDVAKSNGLSLAKLVAAYKAAGVRVTEALDEGSHYHIAWKKVGAEARQQSAEAAEAAREAKRAQEEYLKLLEVAQDWIDLDDRMRAARDVGGRQSTIIREDVEKLTGYKWGSDQDPATQMLRSMYPEMIGSQNAFNETLARTSEEWDLISRNVNNAARGMSDAFGDAGRAIGDMAAIYADYHADRSQMDEEHWQRVSEAGSDWARLEQENRRFALANATAQIGAFGDMTSAAKGFFDEKSKGYQALATAEKVFRAVEFALSVRAMAQDAAETASKLATGAARIATGAVEAVVNAIKSLPFPLNLAAGAATVGALAGIGVSIAGGFGGGKNTLPQSNNGTGTVLGDSAAKSDSIKNAIDALKEVELVTNSYSREMAASLKSIDSQIGGFASVLVRNGSINASGNVQTGFQRDAIGSTLNSIIGGGLLSKIPVLGGIFSAIGNFVGSLFGARIDVTGSGLYGGAQSLGSVKEKGFDADYYSDIMRTKKTFGIVTGRSYWTEYQDADPALANQFTLILRQFNDAVAAAAGPLGMSTAEVERRLNAFVVDIGRIDLQGLSGEQIQEKLTAVFGAVGDNLANAVFPGMLRFQQVGEGAFETLVRVASTVESVTTTLDLLGSSARALSIDAKLSLADQFDSLSAMSSVTQSYFESFYTKEEQAAARTAQFGKVFESLGLAMPSTMAAFRQLVEAQNLTTEAGQATFATLLQLAPAFAELKTSMDGAKSAADVMSERQDLQRQLLELNGDTAALRARDLAKLDASNRALQEQVWAVQDAQEAAKAADELRRAWTSVGDSIMDEVKRIRGITDPTGNSSFASLMGQFNAANAAARGGDQEAAKALPGLSQAMLNAAALVATSRQELNRVQAQTAAALEATNAAISVFANGAATAVDADTLLAAVATAQTASDTPTANEDLIAEIRSLREELSQMRADNNAGHAANASANTKTARVLENVSAASGGEAISVASAA